MGNLSIALLSEYLAFSIDGSQARFESSHKIWIATRIKFFHKLTQNKILSTATLRTISEPCNGKYSIVQKNILKKTKKRSCALV